VPAASAGSSAAFAFQLTGALLFLASLLYGGLVYVVAFGHVAGPWSFADGWPAVAADTALFTLFALHHSLFARLGVKAWVARRVTPALERTTYVWCASLLFIVVMRAWRDVPGLAWQVGGPAGWLLTSLQVLGLVITVRAARRLGVRRLAGLPQPAPSGEAGQTTALERTGLYGFVRHPIYFAWLLMVWPASAMTGSRLTFAVLSTLYLIVAIPFEERALVREFGPSYREYQRHVRWRMLKGFY
jgi:protein-S-isoprenylcysteine O-methyltransferase Ste14